MKASILALPVLLLLLPAASPPAQAGREAHAAKPREHAARGGVRVIRSSPRHPGGRCGRLNLERARLHGLCR